jgi:hypothetical protein
MLALSLSFGAGQLKAQCGSLGAPSTMWENGGNSFWNIDGNWTSGTPTASTNACKWGEYRHAQYDWER